MQAFPAVIAVGVKMTDEDFPTVEGTYILRFVCRGCKDPLMKGPPCVTINEPWCPLYNGQAHYDLEVD